MKSSIRTIEIVQQVQYGMNEEAIQKVLQCQSIDQYAYILHDKEDKQPHYHLCIRFKSPYPISELRSWCEKAGIQVPEGNTIFQKVYKWCSVIAYQTHRNRPEKYQYDFSEVRTNIPTDEYNRLLAQANANVRPFSDILRMIDNDEIAEYNVAQKVSMAEYVRYKKKITDCFQYRNEKGNTASRQLEVWYVYGQPGSGKTTFAKQICTDQEMTAYISSQGKNPFDDYAGQPAVILDDARPQDWRFSDLLKLTDNNTSSMIGCRYYNRHFYRCKLLIITNCEPLDNWMKNLIEANNEDKAQLTRRIKRIIHIEKTDKNTQRIQATDETDNKHIVVSCPDIQEIAPAFSLNRYQAE